MAEKYLSLFDHEMVSDLFSIINSCSDNHRKADMIVEYLKPFKFKELDLGTNIICMVNKRYDDVVFKIALDSCGVEDNFNDIWLSEEIPEYARVYDCHRTGIVSIHKKYKVFDSIQSIQRYYKQIMKILKKLSEEYLIVDLSPENIKNYGTDEKGNLVIIDGSDMIKLSSGVSEFECSELVNKKGSKIKRCGGTLEYDETYHYLVCSRCGKQVNPLTLKKSYCKEVNILKAKHFTPGMDSNQQQVLNNYILKRRQQQGNNDTDASAEISTNQLVDVSVEASVIHEDKVVCDVITYEATAVGGTITEDGDDENHDVVIQKRVPETRPSSHEFINDEDCYDKGPMEDEDDKEPEIKDENIHLMDNGMMVSYRECPDDDTIEIVLSKDKGDTWSVLYELEEARITVSVVISSFDNIVYVFASRETEDGIRTNRLKLDPSKVMAWDIDQDDEDTEMTSSIITDYDGQIQVTLDNDDKTVDVHIDGDISIMTRSNITVSITSYGDETVEITMPELFNLVQEKS